MIITGKKPRSLPYKIVLTLALLASILLLISLINNIDKKLILYGDTFQYWAAGRLFITGENPYDYENVSQLRRVVGYENGIDQNAVSMMLYPPWIFPILIPFSIFSYPTARLLWLFSHLFIVFLSSRTLWLLYKGPKKLELLTYIVAFSFTPALYVLGVGHVTTLHLFGITSFLFLLSKRDQNWKIELTAGFVLGFTLLKPQLQLIFIFAILIWAAYNRRWLILLGMFLFPALNLAISSFFNLNIISQYWDSFSRYQMGTWATPTIGMLLRVFFGNEKDWLQLIPLMIGMIWFVYFWIKHLHNWDWFEVTPLLLLMSFVFSPYTWTYDMVVLILPIIYILIKIINTRFKPSGVIIIAIYLIINFSSLYFHRTRSDFWFFWLAPSLLIWFYFSEKLLRTPSENRLKSQTSLNIDV